MAALTVPSYRSYVNPRAAAGRRAKIHSPARAGDQARRALTPATARATCSIVL